MPRLLVALALALCALPARAQDGADGREGAPALAAAPERGTPAEAGDPAPAPPPAPGAALPYRASDRFDRPTPPGEAPVYYAVLRDARLYAEPDLARPTTYRLDFREGVRVLAQEGAWSLVLLGRTRGYVPSSALSNVWLRVDKSERLLYVYRGPELLRVLPANVSASDEDKTVRGTLGDRATYRMPEGVYFVTRLNPRSEYHRAFVVNYPNREDAAQGLREGVITRPQFETIARAEAEFREPPMGTALGGLIEIHGSGSGRQRAWTRGCVALRNVHMDWLWGIVGVGAPVVIEP